MAGEVGYEPVIPCLAAVARLDGSLEHLPALPLDVARASRPRLRELILADIGDPLALVFGLIALVSDPVAAVGHPVAFVGATLALVKIAT